MDPASSCAVNSSFSPKQLWRKTTEQTSFLTSRHHHLDLRPWKHCCSLFGDRHDSMDAGKEAVRPVWGAKKSWAGPSTLSSSTASSSRDATPSTSASSAFPPLSSPAARRPSSRPSFSPSSSSSSLISPSSFNPYPTRRQELAQRAASHGTRKRNHITRSDPTTSRIHTLFHDDEMVSDTLMRDLDLDHDSPDEGGEVSSRGATMSSIVFRDLSTPSSGTSRSSSLWQQGGMSAGLAMFATTSFGGEPLRVLKNVDEELGAAHMGPRIYKRHNQKHVRNRVRAKIDAGHIAAPPIAPSSEGAGRKLVDPPAVSSSTGTAEDRERWRNADLQKLVDECRRSSSLFAVKSRNGASVVNNASAVAASTLLAAVQSRIADPRSWSASKPHPIISDDLLPTGLQQPPIDFAPLPSPLLSQVQHAFLKGLSHLLRSIVDATRSELIETLARLLSMPCLRPTALSTTFATNPDLKPALQHTLLQLLDVFRLAPSPVELLSNVLPRSASLSGTDENTLLIDLVGELVGLCGQQMSSNPTVLTETQDQTLMTVTSFLSLCHILNSTRPASVRLPAHAFYCTILDLAPFLEHFIHHASFLARPTEKTAGMAEYNITRHSPFLLSLGAKVRVLQLENELRLSKNSSSSNLRDSPTFRAKGRAADAELVILPNAMQLKIEREGAWEQSKDLLLQMLAEVGQGVRGLRVEFVGEQAADGGGPAREWFATVAGGWKDPMRVVGRHGWFIPVPSNPTPAEEKEAEDTAAFLGLLLALAALHSLKLALPFALPAVAFKLLTAPDLDRVSLTPVDLEFSDPALAKSLQTLLDWTSPSATFNDAEKAFDNTFTLTWSTTITGGDGRVQMIDLVPGGRHRSVKLGERREFVSKLVWRVLVGSVRRQVGAFREAWQSVMPSTWLTGANKGAESATEILSRGGLAISLFAPEEIAQAILSLPSSSNPALSRPLDIADIRGATELVLPTSSRFSDEIEVVKWFWEVWTGLEAVKQRRLLAFITGAEDLPATGARGLGLRIHLVPTSIDGADVRAWPLPWSSTCTSTLFLPTYPTRRLIEEKVLIAIEHYQGFGLR